jgi:dethiobiotin synthetase
VAARRAGIHLSLDRLDARWDALRAVGGPIVVEGVGGALVEVVVGVTVADLAARWSLPALVVAGNRLGVLSHTLLTVEALRSRGVRVAGVVLNTLHDGEPSTSEATNAAELGRTLPLDVPLIGTMPFVPGDGAGDPFALAVAVQPLAVRLLALEGTA